jgi:hypothetical protein
MHAATKPAAEAIQGENGVANTMASRIATWTANAILPATT